MSVERELLAGWAAGYALSGSGLARLPVSRPLTAAANWLADASADELVGSMGVPSAAWSASKTLGPACLVAAISGVQPSLSATEASAP